MHDFEKNSVNKKELAFIIFKVEFLFWQVNHVKYQTDNLRQTIKNYI